LIVHIETVRKFGILVINSPYTESYRDFRFSEEGITDEIIEGRRPSYYFSLVPSRRRRGRECLFDTECTDDRVKENDIANKAWDRFGRWRQMGYPHMPRTAASGRLEIKIGSNSLTWAKMKGMKCPAGDGLYWMVTGCVPDLFHDGGESAFLAGKLSPE
jgi:hypothetical protein